MSRPHFGRTMSSLEAKLDAAKEAFTQYARVEDETTFSFNELNRLEAEVKHAEYLLYCEQYEDNRRRNWR